MNVFDFVVKTVMITWAAAYVVNTAMEMKKRHTGR
jgi:hypothetical protein